MKEETNKERNHKKKKERHESKSFIMLLGGRESIKLLMKGAKEVTPSPDKYTRLFLKSGDYETAVTDFQAAKLTAVRNFCCTVRARHHENMSV